MAAALNLKETVVTVQGKNLFPADDAPQELSKAGVTPYSYEGEAEEKQLQNRLRFAVNASRQRPLSTVEHRKHSQFMRERS